MDAKQDEISLIGHKLVYAKNIVAPGQLNVLMKLATQGCFYGVTVQYRTTSAIGWWEGRLGKIISMLFKQTSWNQTWLLLCLFTKHGCNVGIRASKIVCGLRFRKVALIFQVQNVASICVPVFKAKNHKTLVVVVSCLLVNKLIWWMTFWVLMAFLRNIWWFWSRLKITVVVGQR